MALKNAAKLMDYSINSVIGQNYQDFEFIFAIGDSSDETLEKAHKIASHYPAKILEHQNQGIYEALNNGLKLADSDSLICILGAGDFFLHNEVFSLANRNLQGSLEWCISPWVLTDQNYNFIEVSGPQNFNGLDVLTIYAPLCHQTIFAPVSFIVEMGCFNTKYRVAADRDLIYKMWRKSVPTVLNVVNVIYPQGGFSSTHERSGHKELTKLRRAARLCFRLQSRLTKQNLTTKDAGTRRSIPDEVFPWCPSSIKDALRRENIVS
jgi:glycosyltransferase involved in cell wall biosynthesis